VGHSPVLTVLFACEAPEPAPIADHLPEARTQLIDTNDTIDREIRGEDVARGQAQEDQDVAATPSRLPEGLNSSELEDDGARLQENIDVLDPERQLSTHAEAIEGYHAKAVKLINANVNATIDYAWRLAEVRSPAEFIALSTKHAFRHFELIMTRAAAFGISSLSWPAAPNSRDD
jgi:hypothetical protein